MSEPDPQPEGAGPGAGDPSIYETILPNGLHMRYPSLEEVAAIARRPGPEPARRTALLSALRKKLEGR